MEVVFEELFEKSNHKPINYKGHKVCVGDTITLPAGEVHLKITFEKVNSDWEQGIFIRGNSKGNGKKKGKFVINNETFKDGFYLWRSTSPDITKATFHSQFEEVIVIWNIWRIDNGPMQYGHNGAALYFEELPNGRRYYCNDGYPDDDFDDLIFTVTLEIISEEK